MVLVQRCWFSKLFFLGNIGQENVFYDILKRKNAFLGYKKRSSKSRNIDIFRKGLTHGFSPKMSIFPPFFLRNTGQKNVFDDMLERKKAFLGFKNKKLKKSKNWLFSRKVTNGFGSKIAIFESCFFRQYRPGKCLWWYSRTKTRFSRI